MNDVRSLVLLLTISSLPLACAENAPPPKHAEKSRPPPTISTSAKGIQGGSSHSTGMSYEDALSEPEDVMALKSERQLGNDELTAQMKNPTFLTACSVPDSMSLTLKIAVRDGKTLGVSVITRPDDQTVAECIDKAVRDLSWPVSKHRDSFITNF